MKWSDRYQYGFGEQKKGKNNETEQNMDPSRDAHRSGGYLPGIHWTSGWNRTVFWIELSIWQDLQSTQLSQMVKSRCPVSPIGMIMSRIWSSTIPNWRIRLQQMVCTLCACYALYVCMPATCNIHEKATSSSICWYEWIILELSVTLTPTPHSMVRAFLSISFRSFEFQMNWKWYAWHGVHTYRIVS